MGIVRVNDGGKSYDTTTGSQEIFTNFNTGVGVAVQNDSIVGNYVAVNKPSGDIYAYDVCTVPFATAQISGPTIVGMRAKWQPANSYAFLGYPPCINIGNGVGFNTQGIYLQYAGTYFEVGSNFTSSTVIGRFAPPFDPSVAWHYYELEVTNNGDGTGNIRVWIDATQVFVWSGSLPTNAVSYPYNSLDIHNGVLWTDLVIIDGVVYADGTGNHIVTPIHDVVVMALFPISDVGPNGWTPATTGTHFSEVNAAVPPDGTTNLNTLVTGTATGELFGISSLPDNIAAVRGVIPKLHGQQVVGSSLTVKNFVNGTGSGNVSPTGSGVGAGSWQEYSPDLCWGENPVTGLDWVPNDVTTGVFGFFADVD